MKNFYWKAFIEKMELKNFIGLILAVIVTILSTVNLFENYGLDIVIQAFVLSYLYDKFKEAKEALEYLNDKYSIKTNK